MGVGKAMFGLVVSFTITSNYDYIIYMTRCRMNRNKRCQNSFVCFSNEKVIFVFVGLQYDSMKPNHAKKVKK